MTPLFGTSRATPEELANLPSSIWWRHGPTFHILRGTPDQMLSDLVGQEPTPLPEVVHRVQHLLAHQGISVSFDDKASPEHRAAVLVWVMLQAGLAKPIPKA